MRRLRSRRALAALAALLLVGLALALWPLPEELAHPRQEGSVRLLDRNGDLLREVPSSRNGVSRWVSLDEVAPAAIQATLLAEDRRFWYHPGLDPLALLRSAAINLGAGRVLTGGSTITQQLVRNLRPPRDRGLAAKAAEALDALRMELRFSKREILEAYLNRIPYGNGAYGIEAAAWRYFEKPAARLSPAEAATLAVLPRAPEALDLVSAPEEVLALQRDLLEQMGRSGSLSSEDLRLALEEPIAAAPLSERFAAPHFCDFVLADLPAAREVRTTLDLLLQEAAEDLLEAHLRRLVDHGVGNGALVVLDVRTGDILAMVGSRDYFEPTAGQVNGAVALRQPGSTLKPFMYGLALERGQTAATLLPDLDFHPGGTSDGFVPRNYDRTNHGPVRLRTALACSYNLAAVRTLQEIGPQALLERLRDLGFASLDRPAGHYGLGLTLGDGEVSLLELASAYRTLARAGLAGPARSVLAVGEGTSARAVPLAEDRRVLEAASSFVITDILADPEARAPAFGRHGPLALPFPCASKTGTSKDYRDNWTVGFTPRYVVAVWVGNFDGRSMVDASGVTGAAPLFRDLMLELRRRDEAREPPRSGPPAFERPPGLERAVVCPASGQAPGPDCPGTLAEWFRSGSAPTDRCSVHRRVVLDRRTGGLASVSTPEGERREQVYEVYPPLYRSWMADVGLPVPPVGAASDAGRGSWSTRPAAPPLPPEPGSQAEMSSGRPERPSRLAIAFPEDEAVFRIDPVLRREYQAVLLRAVVPEGVQSVEWRLDGRPLARCGSPFTHRWRLAPGRHTLTLAAPGVGEESVTITVLE